MGVHGKRQETREKGVPIRTCPWKEEEHEVILKFIEEHGTGKWSKCAKVVNAQLYDNNFVRSARQVREHWNNCLNPNLKKDPWTSEEDKQIMALYKRFGRCYSRFTHDVVGRNENQIKNRLNLLLKYQRIQNFERQTPTTPKPAPEKPEESKLPCAHCARTRSPSADREEPEAKERALSSGSECDLFKNIKLQEFDVEAFLNLEF